MRIMLLNLAWTILAGASVSPAASEPWQFTDERMIVASDTMVVTFVGESVRVKGEMRTAQVNLHLPKPDKYGASSFAINTEVDCTRKLLREVASVAARSDGGVVYLPREAGDNDFKPVRKDSFAVVIQEHLCGIKRE
ncbi:MAG: hypothetical protein EOO77_10040, partial [Oxalobacteraceae bacterium]